MKNLFKRTFLTVFVLVLVGCSSDLDQDNPNKLSEGTFWQTERQLQQGGIAAYDQLQNLDLYSQGVSFRFTALSDEGTNKWPWEFRDFVKFTLADTDQFGRGFWIENYALIGRAYQVLEREPEFNLPALAGEMQFLVSLGYFNLVGLFGENVAYVDGIQDGLDKPSTAENGELYSLMENLLLTAIPNLPITYPELDYGRVTKGAAQTLLAKIYMQQHRYADAAPLLKAVIDSGQYQLLTNFSDNFTETGMVNSEAVFVVNFSENGTAENTDTSFRYMMFAISGERGVYGDLTATNLMLRAFNAEEAATGSKDSRMDPTIIHPTSSLLYYGLSGEAWAATSAKPDSLQTGFMKYSEQDAVGNNVDPISGLATNRANLLDGGTDYIVLRYADVLLMYAEVLNEQGMTADAVAFVDQVRARADRPGLLTAYPSAIASKAAFFDRLKQERILELSGENCRFFDLKRWGMYNSELQDEDNDFETFIDGKNEVEGIPQTELDLNSNLRPNQAN